MVLSALFYINRVPSSMPRFCYDAGDDGHTLVGLCIRAPGATFEPRF